MPKSVQSIKIIVITTAVILCVLSMDEFFCDMLYMYNDRKKNHPPHHKNKEVDGNLFKHLIKLF